MSISPARKRTVNNLLNDLDVGRDIGEGELVPNHEPINFAETVAGAFVQHIRQRILGKRHVLPLLVEHRGVDELDRRGKDGRRGIRREVLGKMLEILSEINEDRMQLRRSSLKTLDKLLQSLGIDLQIIDGQDKHCEERDVDLCRKKRSVLARGAGLG